MFISLVSLVKAHWLSGITAASCKWCVKWKGFAHPANTGKASRKLCHWTRLGGKDKNSCDTRIKARIHQQMQKIHQAWGIFIYAGFVVRLFSPFLSCSVSFFRELHWGLRKAEWFWFMWLASVLHLKWSLICALCSSMFSCVRSFVLFLSTSVVLVRNSFTREPVIESWLG